MDEVASVCKGKVDVKRHQFNSEPCMVGTVLWDRNLVRQWVDCKHHKSGFQGSTWFFLTQASSIRWCLPIGGAFPNERQTFTLTATTMTPWATEAILLALAAICLKRMTRQP